MTTQTMTTLDKAIDRILWEKWDPIGINHNEAANGEYSS
jgi:hypothetical protein